MSDCYDCLDGKGPRTNPETLHPLKNNMTPEIPYKRKAVEPVECIKAGWELVKPQYWLIVGMCVIGYVIGTAVPLGILMGPMMAGLYLTFFALRRREPVEFGTLFKGFEFF